MLRLTASALVVLLAAPAAHAVDYPKLKSGMWDVTISSTGSQPTMRKTSMCIDASVQGEMVQMGEGWTQRMCKRNVVKVEGGRFVGESECNLGESVATSRSVMSFTGDTGYTTEIDSTYNPPFMGMKTAKTRIDGRHTGACPAGMKPGDMTLPGGQTVNVLQMGQPGKK